MTDSAGPPVNFFHGQKTLAESMKAAASQYKNKKRLSCESKGRALRNGAVRGQYYSETEPEDQIARHDVEEQCLKFTKKKKTRS